jgi:hypothetical protein
MRGNFTYWARLAVTVSCRLTCVCALATADLPVIDLRINAARAGTQTHIDFIDPLLMGQGWEPTPTMTIRTAAKIAKRRMG